MLRDDRMSEAEVSLRLALYLIDNGLAASDVAVAIDGAQVQTAGTVHFRISEFLAEHRCEPVEVREAWQGYYTRGVEHRIRIHSSPGQGDVLARLTTGHTLRAESKKGPLTRSKSSQEYPLVREALGQLLTIERVEPDDLLAVAVPSSPKFEELAARWRRAPLIQRFGIQLLTVGRDGSVGGLQPVPA